MSIFVIIRQWTAGLSVFTTMCRKLLFYILGVLWAIELLLLTFCQEGPYMLHAKFS